MKIKHAVWLLVSAIVVSAGMTACETESEDNPAAQARLQAQAKVARADAEATALAKVPGGTIKEAELEKEKGRLIWSFDVSQPGTTDIKEVNVDATTGGVVNVETEKAEGDAR